MNDKTTTEGPNGALLALASTEGLGPRPVAWMWMQATFHAGDVRGRGWFQTLSILEPKGMPWMVDKLTPLYDQSALDAERKLVLEAVEQRLHSWRQRLMNKSGDRLALDDFMGQESIDDLIDYVCDEGA
jgi:hypothetical protein